MPDVTGGLGRLPQFDERSRGYPIRATIGQVRRQSRTWPCAPHLDQGTEGACVGFAWSHELGAQPAVVPVSNGTALDLYHEAQKIDEYPGVDYEGTSVLAGAKICRGRAHFKSYRWAFGIDDVLDTIVAHGPVVLGIDWHAAMDQPRPSGLLDIGGPVRGGHAILARGVRFNTRLKGEPRDLTVVRLRNSWGPDWASYGDCYVRAEDLATLLETGGEACVPVGREKRRRPRDDPQW